MSPALASGFLSFVWPSESDSESRSVVPDSLQPPMDYTVHGILQTRIMEWVAFPFSRGSAQPRDRTQVSPREVLKLLFLPINFLDIEAWFKWKDLSFLLWKLYPAISLMCYITFSNDTTNTEQWEMELLFIISYVSSIDHIQWIFIGCPLCISFRGIILFKLHNHSKRKVLGLLFSV